MRSVVGKLEPFFAAAALAAVLASLTSCSHCPPVSKDYLDRPPETVSVIVTFDSRRRVAETSNKWVILRGGRDSIQWTSPDGIVSVNFGKDEVFEGPPAYDEGKTILKSKRTRPVKTKRLVEYKATLKLHGGSEVEIDPRIEIWP